MALIGTIRKNSWLLLVMIGVALGAFIFMDVSGASGPGGGGTSFSLGEINGKEVDWNEFQRAEQAYQNTGNIFGQREGLWNFFVEEAILEDEGEKVGLNVGEDEMEELLFGANLSPVVQRNFTDPNTGQINRESLNSFKTALDAGQLAPEFQSFWNFQRQEVAKERLQGKLTSMVQKGLYTPTWMAQRSQTEGEVAVDFAYVQIPYDLVEDSEIEVSEADYASYIQEHATTYQRENEMRDAAYVVFDVLPTPEDSLLLREKMDDIVTAFKTTDEDSIFAENNYGVYNTIYYKQGELSEVIADTVFDLPIDSVYGPYIDQGAYTAVKVIGRKMIPDSVRSRHVLIGVGQNATQDVALAAIAQADTLLKQLQSGAESWDSIALKHSADPGSSVKGGDLGFVSLGTFVKPMNDLLFYADIGDDKIYKVPSQFGIHLVEVLDKKYLDDAEEGVKLAYVNEVIIPSEGTQEYLYDDVLEFVGLNRTVEQLRTTAAGREDVELKEAKNLPENGFALGGAPDPSGLSTPELAPGQTSREAVKWLYDKDTKVGQVAPGVYIYEDEVNYFNSKYVVVALESIHEPGLASVDDVKDLIEADVKNRKRAALLKSRITSSNLPELATQFDVDMDSVKNARFNVTFLSNLGNEPKVLARATSMEIGETSEPIVGENGVYVIQILEKSVTPSGQTIPGIRKSESFSMQNAAQFELISALRKRADIKDQRASLY